MLFEDFIMATDIGLFILASTVLSKYLIKLCRIYAPDILVELSLFLPAKDKCHNLDSSFCFPFPFVIYLLFPMSLLLSPTL